MRTITTTIKMRLSMPFRICLGWVWDEEVVGPVGDWTLVSDGGIVVTGLPQFGQKWLPSFSASPHLPQKLGWDNFSHRFIWRHYDNKSFGHWFGFLEIRVANLNRVYVHRLPFLTKKYSWNQRYWFLSPPGYQRPLLIFWGRNLIQDFRHVSLQL